MDIEELKKRLREHDDPRLYREADALMSEAADAIESLQRELEEARRDADLFQWMQNQQGCPFAETDDAWDDLRTAIRNELTSRQQWESTNADSKA